MSSPELQKNILTTLAYYDAMDYPLTAFEVWKYLTRLNGETGSGTGTSLLEVIKNLESPSIAHVAENVHGFYFLKGRRLLVRQRLSRNKVAERKMRRLLWVVKWLRCVPYVRMIGVTGRLAMKNTEPGSDLDLLVVLKQGKIFTGRFLFTAAVHLLGHRRYGNKITDRVCLNFFLTDKSLEINLKDLYSASEYTFIFPVFGFETFHKFQGDNLWIRKFKPGFQADALANLRMCTENWLVRSFRRSGEMLFSPSLIENWLKKWQTMRIEKDPRTHQAGSLVVANDAMLVFLPGPQSPLVFDKFQKSLENLAKNQSKA